MRYLHRVTAENFLSLAHAEVELQELNVLVGPNGAGKSNFLKLIQFLGDTARLDLGPAIEQHGGFEAMHFRGHTKTNNIFARIKIKILAQVTTHASETALDEYALSFWRGKAGLLRQEDFKFKRTRGGGRRITVSGSKFEVVDDRVPPRERELDQESAALSTLPRLGEKEGAVQVRQLAELFRTFRIFDVDVTAARRPAPRTETPQLKANAENLADYLAWLAEEHEDIFDLLQEDLRYMLPGLWAIHLTPVAGSSDAVAIELEEEGLRGRTPLRAASFGTIRALSLLAMLHDPAPPKLSCVEEIDHGLHPYALDRIVERLRSAARRTQLLVATHSPALVNRLEPSELVVCERDPSTGASRIPAIEPAEVEQMANAGGLDLGELWFSGALGGVVP